MGFLCLTCFGIFAQNQQVADSLIKIYKEDALQDTLKLKLLEDLSFNERKDLNLSLKFAEELIALSKLENNYEYLSRGYIQKGNINRMQGNLDVALDAFFKSSEAAILAKKIKAEGVANMSIADIYSEIDNSINAEIYYEKAINLLRKTDDTVSLATALINAGDESFNAKKFEIALQYFEESGILFREANYLIGTAYNKGNIGMVYAEQGKYDLAEANINEAIEILEKLQDYYPISVYLTYMSDIYLRKKDYPRALSYAEKSLELATTYGLKEQISEANLKLSDLYDSKGNQILSYKYYKDHITFRDSVKNLESIQEMANLRTDYEVSQKQNEVNLLNQQKKTQRIVVIAISIALFLIGIMAIGLLRRNKFIQKTKKIIEREKERSDKLLLNILPEETAQELKDKGKVKGKKYDDVSVLFSDFKGFTSYSENLSPEDLVETVDFYFSKFDEIIEKHELEKIKTIGDAYMCAGGLGKSYENHAQNAVNAAFEIASFVEKTKNDRSASDLTFDIRIGISSGPVVAGVVGTKKFAYDIWGDTVNIASRMESASEAGKINISDSTFVKIKDQWTCEYRGEIQVKNKGAMKMYFVNSH